MEGPKPTYNVIANQNISIPCEVSATPTAIVTWYKDSLLLSNADQRFQMAEHNLIITFIQANYSGVFYCKAENKYGEVRSEKATVVVYCESDFLFTVIYIIVLALYYIIVKTNFMHFHI